MSFYTKINSSLKVSNVFVKIPNTQTLKEAKNIWVKNNNGILKPIWNYRWNTGNWSECNVPCGGGIQTRTVTCTRNDGIIKSEKFCSDITKPTTQQSCNTQSCYAVITFVNDCNDPTDSAWDCPEWGTGWLSQYFSINISNPNAGENCYISLQASYKSRRDTGDGTVGFKNVYDGTYNEIRTESIKTIIDYDAPSTPDTGLSSIGGYRNDDFSYSCYDHGSWRGGVYVPKFYLGKVPLGSSSYTCQIYKARRGHDHGMCITIKSCWVE